MVFNIHEGGEAWYIVCRGGSRNCKGVRMLYMVKAVGIGCVAAVPREDRFF